jgi:hypothetical protein
MKTGIRYIAALVAFIGLVADVAAEQETDSGVSLIQTEHKNTVTIRHGTFSLAKRNQKLKILGPETQSNNFWGDPTTVYYPRTSLPIEIDQMSHEVISIGYERQSNRGFSYGGELLHIKNAYVIPSPSPSEGHTETVFIFYSLKKYFGQQGGFQPFVAGGIGGGSSVLIPSTKNGEQQSARGLAGQLTAGIRYQGNRISGFAEYRYVYAPSISYFEGQNTGDIEGDLDLSGHGYFVGLGIRF